MSTKDYAELCNELEHLQSEFDNESNSEVRSEIEGHIADVKGLIENYDLGDDDLFECHSCKKVFDIEMSVKSDDKNLYCEKCSDSINGLFSAF